MFPSVRSATKRQAHHLMIIFFIGTQEKQNTALKNRQIQSENI